MVNFGVALFADIQENFGPIDVDVPHPLDMDDSGDEDVDEDEDEDDLDEDTEEKTGTSSSSSVTELSSVTEHSVLRPCATLTTVLSSLSQVLILIRIGIVTI